MLWCQIFYSLFLFHTLTKANYKFDTRAVFLTNKISEMYCEMILNSIDFFFKALSNVHLQTVVHVFVSQECYLDQLCNGINYHSTTETCELIPYNTSKWLLTGEEYADAWQLWLPGICMSVLLQRALHICIDFFKEKKRIITRMISWAWKYTCIAIVILLR